MLVGVAPPTGGTARVPPGGAGVGVSWPSVQDARAASRVRPAPRHAFPGGV